jgi:cell wall-associated NlpC family hydrolase
METVLGGLKTRSPFPQLNLHIHEGSQTVFGKMILATQFLNTALFLCLVFVACKRLEKDTPPAVTEAIAAVQQSYCPDRRLCVFDISVQMRGANLKLIGEVTDPAAKRELLLAVKAAVNNFKVEEEIHLLPDATLGHNRFGMVRVSVASLRGGPAHAAELVHQQLMGSLVRLLKREKGWCYVQTEDGYLAWAPAGSLYLTDSVTVAEWRASDLVAFEAMDGVTREEPKDGASPVSALILGCVAQKIAEVNDAASSSRKKWLQVELPDGRNCFVERELMAKVPEVYSPAPRSPRHVTTLARQFLGIPYLWGGTTTDGFDCSGFTQTVFRMNGVSLLRDASQQARQGQGFDPGDDFANLQPADLLFFGEDPGKITHVAISLGGAHFIHASDFVQINSLNPEDADYVDYRRNTFQFARRFFAPAASNGKQ